jgi:hypothetical protein
LGSALRRVRAVSEQRPLQGGAPESVPGSPDARPAPQRHAPRPDPFQCPQRDRHLGLRLNITRPHSALGYQTAAGFALPLTTTTRADRLRCPLGSGRGWINVSGRSPDAASWAASSQAPAIVRDKAAKRRCGFLPTLLEGVALRSAAGAGAALARQGLVPRAINSSRLSPTGISRRDG